MSELDTKARSVSCEQCNALQQDSERLAKALQSLHDAVTHRNRFRDNERHKEMLFALVDARVALAEHEVYVAVSA